MKLGFIGLGKMGKNMVLHLLEEGIDVVVYNRTRERTEELISENKKQEIRLRRQAKNRKQRKLIPAYSVSGLINNLKPPRVIWLMVPNGRPVDEVIEKLLDSGLDKGDTVIDGGNCYYKDSLRRYRELKKKDIKFLDVGVSGGLEGAREGACLMIGGEKKIYRTLIPLFEKLAGEKGSYNYFGPAGAGHFVKMVHNGIEYGMLEAIGEGFEILEKNPYTLNLVKVARSYSQGSVVRGWLMDLLEKALRKSPRLDDIEGVIGGGETGSWTVKTAKELKVATPVIEKSVVARKRSLAKPTFSGKVIASLRREFGGHKVKN